MLSRAKFYLLPAVLFLLIVGSPIARIAAQQGEPPLPRFEVASVKPVDPKVIPHMVGINVYPGGRVLLLGLTLKELAMAAFGLSSWQISGGEAWVDRDQFDIEAKPGEDMRSRIKDLRHTYFGIEDEHLREMLQALLIDRFQLKFHRESKTGDVYLLERSGKTPALRPTEPGSTDGNSVSHTSMAQISYTGQRWSIFRSTMAQLAKFASDYILHAPVQDRTGLSGAFDYRQEAADLEPDYSGSFLRLIPVLGLKLERSKGPVEHLVLEYAAKPGAN